VCKNCIRIKHSVSAPTITESAPTFYDHYITKS
jgi:hypothetical protein